MRVVTGPFADFNGAISRDRRRPLEAQGAREHLRPGDPRRARVRRRRQAVAARRATTGVPTHGKEAARGDREDPDPGRRRPPPRRRSAPRSARTASTSWTSARRTTPRRRTQRGTVIPAEITIFEDRTFTFVTKTPPTPVLLRQAAGIEKGAPRTPAARTVGQGHEGPDPPDRRDEDARPQRRSTSTGAMAQIAGHRPLDGHRSRRLTDRPRRRRTSPPSRSHHRGSSEEERTMTKHGKEYSEAAQRYDRDRPLHEPAEAFDLVKSPRPGEVRRDRRSRLQARRRPPQGRPDDPRHRLAAQRDRSRTCGSRCSRPATQRREAEAAGADVVGADDLIARIEGGFLDFDVAIATPDLMGQVGQARPRARPARPHAEPQDGHRHERRRQGRRGSSRAARSSTEPTGTATSTSRSARSASPGRPARELPRRARRARAGQARRGEGPIPPGRLHLLDHGPRRQDRRHRRARPTTRSPAAPPSNLHRQQPICCRRPPVDVPPGPPVMGSPPAGRGDLAPEVPRVPVRERPRHLVVV